MNIEDRQVLIESLEKNLKGIEFCNKSISIYKDIAFDLSVELIEDDICYDHFREKMEEIQTNISELEEIKAILN